LQPRHLSGDRDAIVHPRPADAPHEPLTGRVNPERRVVLVAQQPQLCALVAESSQRECGHAMQAGKLSPPLTKVA